MLMRDRIHTMEIFVLKQDLTFLFELSNTTLIPFTTPLLELYFKIDQLWQKGDWLLKDIKGDIIIYFHPEVIKEAFQWRFEGSFKYSKVDSLACYQDTNKVAKTIKSWL